MLEKLFGWEKCGDAWLKFEPCYGGYTVSLCKQGSLECAIPAEYKGKNVISISENAFAAVTTLRSVTIPDTVSEIGAFAFGDSGSVSSLSEVHISDLFAWCNIAFRNNSANPLWYAGRLFLGGKELTRLEIPDGVECLRGHQFAGLKNITEVVVPSSVTCIGDESFYRCQSLSRVEISEGVEKIGEKAFASCGALCEVSLPSTLKEIGDSAFENCPSLCGIDIPDSVESVGYSAFKDSFKDGKVRIGKGLKTIGGYAFSGARIAEVSITDMDTWSELQLSTCSPVGNGTVVFYGEWEMDEFAFKNGIYEIKTGALANFGELISVYIPASIRSIQSRAFTGCNIHTIHYGGTAKQWKQVKIDDGNEALRYVENWVYSSRPFGVDVGRGDADEKVSAVEDMPYGGNGWVTLGDAEVWVKPTDDGNGWIITECNNEPTRLILPALLGGKPILEIDGFAFQNHPKHDKDYQPVGTGVMDNLAYVKLSDTVRVIGSGAFENCVGLVDIHFGSGLVTIERSAFEGCAALEGMSLPEGLVRIESNAFSGCVNLKSLEIPSTTTDLFEGIVKGCHSLTSLSVREGNSSFHSDRDCIISDDSSELYIGCVDSVIPMDGTVTSIGYGAFEGAGVKKIVIPVGVTTIGTFAFASTPLEKITIPHTVNYIGDGAFFSCERLESIELPEGLDRLISGLFNYAKGLREVYIPSSVREIESYAFNECEALATVRFGGTKEEYEAITVGENNEALLRAEVIFLK